MRIVNRDGSADVFSADSRTSPEKTAFRGITVPFSRVATVSLAFTLVPTGVLPATTFCCRTTGNSRTGAAGTGGLCCAKMLTGNNIPKIAYLNAIRGNIVLHPEQSDLLWNPTVSSQYSPDFWTRIITFLWSIPSGVRISGQRAQPT